MKDYLKEELSQEEKLILVGLIWNVSKKFRINLGKENERYCEFNEETDGIAEDTYEYKKIEFIHKGDIRPISDEEKCNIVMYMDYLLREVCLFELIKTLTFDEKLVFFLFYIEELKIYEISNVLGFTERTVYNKRISINNKVKEMKGDK